MSSSEPNDGNVPQAPPTTSNPLQLFIIPAVLFVVLVFGTYFFVIPLFWDVKKANDGFKSLSRPPVYNPQPVPQPWNPPR